MIGYCQEPFLLNFLFTGATSFKTTIMFTRKRSLFCSVVPVYCRPEKYIGFLFLIESWSVCNSPLLHIGDLCFSSDKMDPVVYLNRVVIAKLNHLTVFHTEGSHSWIDFILCLCSWLGLDYRCSVGEWFHANWKSSVDFSLSFGLLCWDPELFSDSNKE